MPYKQGWETLVSNLRRLVRMFVSVDADFVFKQNQSGWRTASERMANAI